MARQYRQLGELRADLRALVGAASSGASAGVNSTLVDVHIRNAQTSLYWTHDWAHLRKYETLNLGASQFLLDYPTTANPDRIQALSVLQSSVWSPALPKGITPQLYTTQDTPSFPQRWEPYEQIQIYPLSDQAYSIRCFFIKNLDPLTDSADRCTLDDTMIELVAGATLKAHYRQPDAAIWMSRSDALILRLKENSWGQTIFRPDDYAEMEAIVKPQVTT